MTASKHSKTSALDAALAIQQIPETATPEATEIIIASLTEDPRETIAKLAYGYWEARGGQGGDSLADWVRAEEEYQQILRAV